jgi:hypothetical protein
VSALFLRSHISCLGATRAVSLDAPCLLPVSELQDHAATHLYLVLLYAGICLLCFVLCSGLFSFRVFLIYLFVSIAICLGRSVSNYWVCWLCCILQSIRSRIISLILYEKIHGSEFLLFVSFLYFFFIIVCFFGYFILFIVLNSLLSILSFWFVVLFVLLFCFVVIIFYFFFADN